MESDDYKGVKWGSEHWAKLVFQAFSARHPPCMEGVRAVVFDALHTAAESVCTAVHWTGIGRSAADWQGVKVGPQILDLEYFRPAEALQHGDSTSGGPPGRQPRPGRGHI